MDDLGVGNSDPFLRNYQPTDLRIASEFLTTWLPFLSRDLCHNCVQILSDRVSSLNPGLNGGAQPVCTEHNVNYTDSHMSTDNRDDNSDIKSFESGKDGGNGRSESLPEASTSEEVGHSSPLINNPGPRISWADMAQEDELEEEEEDEECEVNKRLVAVNVSMGELTIPNLEKPKLSREQREYIRFMNVKRKKDFICLERFKGKIVNILDGLELHTGIFSAVEQKRIVNYIYTLQDMGKKGELRERTYTAPQKWMKGKGRVTIQFGCCYNYAVDKKGNPPGILQSELVDPMPHLLKKTIRRLIRWHVLPPSCVPDSCIVNIYEEGDCIPPHIDNHDFLRPFCTVSFLSECSIVFGSNLKIVGAGEFSGPIAIPLPVGSVLVLNGNGADVAKHCVPAVPTKRISITFRKMDESKQPIGFVPEPDLQGIEPYEVDKPKTSTTPKFEHHGVKREKHMETTKFSDRTDTRSDPRYSNRNQWGPPNRRRFRVNMES